MPAGEIESPFAPVLNIDSAASLRVDCYVRGSVPPAITATIDDVVERLRDLDERDVIDDYRVTHWPPEYRSTAGSTGENGSSRDELVAEFERWAARKGHSLEPAFRRQAVPPSPFDTDSDEPRERVRVPVVALAISEVEEDATIADAVDADAASIRGVVPYTERPSAERSRTYTVNDLLATVEANGNDVRPGTHQREGPTPLEGRQ
ncbi:HTH domain-containing protein [Haloterrigena salifodinae]|uniref:HTH domain-containing protein n=1 Tax=Haloterrigena salifodinae TaxID=2675099 RepID=UPI000F891618|nr:HTH domain-containing protein [Haloterrigena salifodinae]